MALCHTIPQPPRIVRRRASLPLTLILLLYLCLQTCVSVELPRDEQQRDDPESALSDLDSTAYTDNLAAIELEENTLLKPQTEWRSDISGEAAQAFSAAVAAQRAIKEASPSDSAAVAAFSLLSSAASLGHPGAQRELGLAFKYGVGVSSNATRAAEFFALAAEQGDIVALREKAIYFSSGHGGHPISEALAVLYLSLASNAADPIASTILGSRHLTGYGVPRCCSCAVKLLLPVAKGIIKSAVVPSGAPQLERRRVTRAMAAGFTKSEHRDFQSDSDVFAYHVYSSAHGDVHSIMQLASMYLHGSRGVRRNFTEAAKWYRVASEMGDLSGMVSFGTMALKGLGMPANSSEALRLFQKAMSHRHPGGYNGMGYMYLHGIGVEQDMKRAKDCFDRAMELGSADAKFNIGAMMLGGFGVAKDYGQALVMFSHAANMGHLHALFNVAMMHLNGFGTQRNCHLASTYLKMMHAGFSRWMAGDQESSLSHYVTAGVAGLEIAQVNVAEILTTKQEWAVALEWWHRARCTVFSSAIHGGPPKPDLVCSSSQNVEAKLRLADAYYHGLGCPRDPAAAAVMYRSAADSKNVEAMVALGMLHHHGDVGVVQDHSLALKWYESAIASASAASAMPARVLIMVLYKPLPSPPLPVWMVSILDA